jgi:hypothetical protein
VFIINDSSSIPEIAIEIKRLEGLLQDLKRARMGQHPNHETIANAPVLDGWQIARRPEPCLVGTMHGHPYVQDGHLGMTSGVWLLAPTHGYARTLSRIYALRRPAARRDDLNRSRHNPC